jgi:hypothetical protein
MGRGWKRAQSAPRQSLTRQLAFKRMKSIMGLGHLPKKDPASARAWLHGKIFASLLVERMVQAAETFSPWGYRLDREAQPLEGN